MFPVMKKGPTKKQNGSQYKPGYLQQQVIQSD